ncbi:MAG: extracellular solute-binding protein, partial [Dehalococcoidia bacterium]|nr:extracellular solute-binding protein [Dehalococcoidia bacterium]
MVSFSRSVMLILAVSLFTFSCAGQEKPALLGETPKLSPTPVSTEAKEAWQKEWDDTMVKAKKEGKVVLYTFVGPQVRTALARAFTQKYGIELEMVAASPVELVERVLREKRTGLNLADLYGAGATSHLLNLKPFEAFASMDSSLILPEVKDPKVWWGGVLPYVDPEHQIVIYMLHPNLIWTVNTEMVKPEDEPKSYQDMLLPKWKGKIAMADPTVPGSGSIWFNTEIQRQGRDFFVELAKQEPLITRDTRLQVEWVAKGRYLLAVTPLPEIVNDFILAGAPLKAYSPSDFQLLTAGTGALSLIANAPHPNAAKVYINWILSKEGGKVFSEAIWGQSARVDVSAGHLPAWRTRAPGIQYIN